MPAGANTKSNIGIRRYVKSLTPTQFRNFEVNGTQQYVVMTDKGYTHGGVTHAKNATIPYDTGGNTKYTDANKMERDYNRHVLDPAN